MDDPRFLARYLDFLSPERPNVSRIYDYFLGGSANFEADRAAAEELRAIYPDIKYVMWANRAFLRRAVQFVVDEGFEQILDIGSGLPTVGNVHEIAHRRNPAVRVVYVDIDPVAIAYSRQILREVPTCAAIEADARRPEVILAHPEVRRLLDFSKPVAVLLVALLHFVTDDDEAMHIVRVLRDRLPSGGYLVIAHGTDEGAPREPLERGTALYARTTSATRPRSHAAITAYFDGLELVSPGLVYAPLWRPDNPADPFQDQPERSLTLVGVGRKP